MELKDRLSQLRINHKMTMEQVGEKVGASKVAVSRWEKGDRMPKKEYLQAYADYFGVSIDWLKYGNLEEYIFSVLEKQVLEEHRKEIDELETEAFELLDQYPDSESYAFTRLNEYKQILAYPLYNKAKIMAEMWNKESYPTTQEIEQLYNRMVTPVGYKDNLIVQANTLETYADNFRYFVNVHNELNDEIIENLNKYRELLEEAQKQAQKTLKLFK